MQMRTSLSVVKIADDNLMLKVLLIQWLSWLVRLHFIGLKPLPQTVPI